MSGNSTKFFTNIGNKTVQSQMIWEMLQKYQSNRIWKLMICRIALRWVGIVKHQDNFGSHICVFLFFILFLFITAAAAHAAAVYIYCSYLSDLFIYFIFLSTSSMSLPHSCIRDVSQKSVSFAEHFRLPCLHITKDIRIKISMNIYSTCAQYL